MLACDSPVPSPVTESQTQKILILFLAPFRLPIFCRRRRVLNWQHRTAMGKSCRGPWATHPTITSLSWRRSSWIIPYNSKTWEVRRCFFLLKTSENLRRSIRFHPVTTYLPHMLLANPEGLWVEMRYYEITVTPLRSMLAGQGGLPVGNCGRSNQQKVCIVGRICEISIDQPPINLTCRCLTSNISNEFHVLKGWPLADQPGSTFREAFLIQFAVQAEAENFEAGWVSEDRPTLVVPGWCQWHLSVLDEKMSS